MRPVVAALLVAAFATARAQPAAPGSECSGDVVSSIGSDTSRRLSLDLNIPSFRLLAREGGIVVREIPVAVGRPMYSTPVGSYGVDYVVWNPPWTPPPSPWARNEKAQPPGPDNWMGRVKMHFTGLVFLHGSPFTRSFGTAASHACVRMSNVDAIALARLVHRYGSPGLDSVVLDSLVADSRRTHPIALKAVIPLRVRYELAEVREGNLEIYPDVYPQRRASQRAHVVAALATHGVTMDSASLTALLKRARRVARVVPLDSLRGLGAGR